MTTSATSVTEAARPSGMPPSKLCQLSSEPVSVLALFLQKGDQALRLDWAGADGKHANAVFETVASEGPGKGIQRRVARRAGDIRKVMYRSAARPVTLQITPPLPAFIAA